MELRLKGGHWGIYRVRVGGWEVKGLSGLGVHDSDHKA